MTTATVDSVFIPAQRPPADPTPNTPGHPAGAGPATAVTPTPSIPTTPTTPPLPRTTAERRAYALRVASDGAYDLLRDVADTQVAARATHTARTGGAR